MNKMSIIEKWKTLPETPEAHFDELAGPLSVEVILGIRDEQLNDFVICEVRGAAPGSAGVRVMRLQSQTSHSEVKAN